MKHGNFSILCTFVCVLINKLLYIMSTRKNIFLASAAVLFLLSGALLQGVFTLSDYKGAQPLDKFYFILFTSLFWFSTAFLISQIVHTVVWGKLLTFRVGSSASAWIKDFVHSFIYTIAAGIVLLQGFFLPLNAGLIVLLVILLIVMGLFRQRVFELVNGGGYLRVKPFNPGNYVIIRSRMGNTIAEGTVHAVHQSSVFIKTPATTLISLPHTVLSDATIENYESFDTPGSFRIPILFDFRYETRRIKRILNASVLEAFEQMHIEKGAGIRILVDEINESGLEYVIECSFPVSLDMSPAIVRSAILETIYVNVKKAGIRFDHLEPSTIETESAERPDALPEKERLYILKQNELLSTLHDAELISISQHLIQRAIAPGTSVINQGDSGDSMFILVEGIADVFVEKKGDRKVKVGRLTAGDFFGEMSLFTGESRSASVVARTEVLVFELSKELMTPILQKRKTLADEISAIIVKRHNINIARTTSVDGKHGGFTEALIGRIRSFFKL